MKKNYTHIAVILDRSGSMESIRSDVIGGFNAFLEEQKKEKGSATLTLVQFDGQEPNHVVHEFANLAKIPGLTQETFVPRGSTPLLDAVGQTLAQTQATLFGMLEKDRPERVVVVVITDGMENASREYTAVQVRQMVKKKSDAGWQFVYLSSDLTAVEDAAAYGFGGASTMAFDQDSEGTRNMMMSASARIRDFRSGTASGVAFSPTDRDMQRNESRRKPRGNKQRRRPSDSDKGQNADS